MNLENVWIFRNWLYVTIATILCVSMCYKLLAKQVSYERVMLHQMRNTSAQFWPPDLVPHPNLPETLPSPLPPLKYA
jgi:hypothetical protein